MQPVLHAFSYFFHRSVQKFYNSSYHLLLGFSTSVCFSAVVVIKFHMLWHLYSEIKYSKSFSWCIITIWQPAMHIFFIYFYVYTDMAFCNSHTWPEGHLWSWSFKPILELFVFSTLNLYCNFNSVTTYLPFCLSYLSIYVCNNFNLLLILKICNSFLIYTVLLSLCVYWAAEYRRSSFAVFAYYVALLVIVHFSEQ